MAMEPQSPSPRKRQAVFLFATALAMFTMAALGAAVGSWLIVRHLPSPHTADVVTLAANCPATVALPVPPIEKNATSDRPPRRRVVRAKPSAIPRTDWWRDVVKSNPYL